MNMPVTILLIDNSAITSLTLIELLQNTPEVENVFYAKDVRKGCAMFAVSTIDVMILATHLVSEELVRLSNLCKLFGCQIILLSEYTYDSYSSWCREIGVAYLLNKASGVNQVGEILKRFQVA